jgi:predicted negative regulator of RcsB-dependent stress response
MATSHYKIKTKDLKGPDEFVTTVDRIGDYLVNNVVRVIVGAAVSIALIAVILTYFFYRSHQNQVVANRFYDALTALEHKDYKTAGQSFETLAQSGSGKLANLAHLYAASAFMSENQPAKARDALEAYLAGGNQRYFRSMALVQLGAVYENLGNFKKAHDAYAQAAAKPGPEKNTAELGAARTLAEQGDTTGAIAAYRTYLAANPYARDHAEVVAELADLGASPTTSNEAAAPTESSSVEAVRDASPAAAASAAAPSH